MIQKAIEKIDGEMKSGGFMERTLGKYVKENLLTNDGNALKILAPNADLETFMERLWKIAGLINKALRKVESSDKVDEVKNKKEFYEKSNDLGWRTISIIKTGTEPKNDEKADNISDENLFISKLIMETYFDSEKVNDGVCLTSEIVTPLLRIYYGIPLEGKAEAAAPKRRRFSAVSLD